MSNSNIDDGDEYLCASLGDTDRSSLFTPSLTPFLPSSSVAVIGLPFLPFCPPGAGANNHGCPPNPPATLAGLGLAAARCDSHPGEDGGDIIPTPTPCPTPVPVIAPFRETETPLTGLDLGNGTHCPELARDSTPLAGRLEPRSAASRLSHSPIVTASSVGLGVGVGLGGGDQCSPPAASNAEQTLWRVSLPHSNDGRVGESVAMWRSRTGGGAAQVWLRGRGPDRGVKVTGA